MKKKLFFIAITLFIAKNSFADEIVTCPEAIVCDSTELKSCSMIGGTTKKWRLMYFPWDEIVKAKYTLHNVALYSGSERGRSDANCIYGYDKEEKLVRIQIKNAEYEIVPLKNEYWGSKPKEKSLPQNCSQNSEDCSLIIKNT